MVESSKILTVSYGTFSCTLEGFDDSFGTMKAIAEYFRDLAQGDRYFGAEPPAPDAEMLTRIAEKEIARRVEARADESGIVLRAVEADKAPAMPPVATPPSVEEVAEVEAPVVEEIAESTHAATADVDGDVAGPEAGEISSPTLVASSPAAPEVAEDSAEEMDVTAPAASFADMDTSAITEVPAHPDANSVAAKLQRIRAVVGAGATAAEDVSLEDSMTEELASETAFEEEDTVSAEDTISEITAEDDFDGEDENDVEADAEMSDFEDDTEEFVEDVAEIDEPEELAEEASDLEVAETDDVISDEDDSAIEEVAEVESAEEVAEDEAADEVAEVEASDDIEEDDVAVESASDDVAEDEAPKQNFRARILRVAKKPVIAEPEMDDAAFEVEETVAAQLDDDLAADTALFDDIAPEEVAELTTSDAITEGTLSDEDEAELMADLAEVERETEALKPIAPTGRDILPEADDAAMSRIMHEADEQLSEPEGSRRRSAIAQLKAAVAATEAARQLGDKGDDAAAKENAFRDDLNEAVRPRSAGDLPRTQVRTERPRPAPLKLVPAQRVSEEAGEEPVVAPVAPRRVAAETSNVDAGSFADFAAEMGASELPDLLEAAAAYTAYVEGIEDFSRPQIMKKVQASATEEFSREDGLRSFGTLLRQGRISKVRNGRFQVSDQTRFKPEKKAG